MLWVGFHPFQDADIVDIVTTGLVPFVGREVEFDIPKITIRSS
jgi:hypothetical protein